MRRLALFTFIMMATPLQAQSLVASFEKAVHNGDVVLPLVMALLAGVLTALSPCVYPLIPITLSIMGTRRYESHLQGFLVALSYVVGMSLIYCALGATFASIGLLLGSFMQHPAVLLVIAGLFFLMALSMFGVFNVVLPERLLTKLSTIGGQGFKGAFLMGMVAGLLAAPCTGPVLGFILTLIANESNIVQGVTLMLAFSFGMGAPFLILGTFFSAITRLPKSGPWMDNVKYIFGATILGTAIYYFSVAWPDLGELLKFVRGFGTSFLITALILGLALLALHPAWLKGVARTLKQIIGAAVGSLAISAMLTFDDGNASLDAVSTNSINWFVIDSSITTKDTFSQLLEKAKANGQPVLVDFYADWCVACKQLELLTFLNEGVVEELKRFTLIRIDSTQSSDLLSEVQNRFRITGLPSIVFLNSYGKATQERVLGFLPPEKLLPILKAVN